MSIVRRVCGAHDIRTVAVALHVGTAARRRSSIDQTSHTLEQGAAMQPFRLASFTLLLASSLIVTTPAAAQTSDDLFDPSVLHDIELTMKPGEARLTAGVFGTSPLYLSAEADVLHASWDLTELRPLPAARSLGASGGGPHTDQAASLHVRDAVRGRLPAHRASISGLHVLGSAVDGEHRSTRIRARQLPRYHRYRGPDQGFRDRATRNAVQAEGRSGLWLLASVSRSVGEPAAQRQLRAVPTS